MKTTYIISTLFLSVLIWACDLMGDVDKVKPYYKLEDQTAIRNAQSAEQVLRGVYTQWRAMSLCNFRSHIGLLAGSLALSGSGGLAGETGFTDNNVLEDNSIIGNVYNNLYDVINAANFMIEFLENNTVKDLDPCETYGNIRRRLFQPGHGSLYVVTLFRAILRYRFSIWYRPVRQTLPGTVSKGPARL